jgi:hypothetical protein
MPRGVVAGNPSLRLKNGSARDDAVESLPADAKSAEGFLADLIES